jgi:hypothetical protein
LRLITAGHLFRRPSSITVDGTSSLRTRNVSIRVPAAGPNPTALSCPPFEPPPPAIPNTANGPPRMKRDDSVHQDRAELGARRAVPLAAKAQFVPTARDWKWPPVPDIVVRDELSESAARV